MKERSGDSRSGFTVIELLIFAAIFSVVTVSFIAILVAVTRVNVRQSSTAEVNQLLLQNIQSYVEQSSLVELPADTATTSLKLRMATSSVDPTNIFLQSGIVYLQQNGGTAQPLTTNRVSVSALTFTKRANTTGGKDSVAVAFTMTYNTTNTQQAFTQGFQTSIARVNAATFDSNVIPSSNNLYKLGATSQVWTSVNDQIYFSGSNVGVGVSNPGAALEVNGGLRLNTATTQPTCDATQRGTFWVDSSGSKDNVQVCARNASSTYGWRTIY